MSELKSAKTLNKCKSGSPKQYFYTVPPFTHLKN